DLPDPALLPHMPGALAEVTATLEPTPLPTAAPPAATDAPSALPTSAPVETPTAGSPPGCSLLPIGLILVPWALAWRRRKVA
ncbi:MAG: hypothetical protein WHV44_10270, partial [Anaerolineales bacterium]